MSANEKALPLDDDDEKVETDMVTTINRSKDYALVYSNFAQCGFTAWDIRINFGLVGITQQGEPSLTEQAAVILTPNMAKALVGVLNGHVKAYERQNGEIQMPRSVIDEAARRKAAQEEQQKAEAPPAEAKSK